ncbi:MAG: hypothetical protein WCV84_05500 [Patescibacteria group bacterium]
MAQDQTLSCEEYAKLLVTDDRQLTDEEAGQILAHEQACATCGEKQKVRQAKLAKWADSLRGTPEGHEVTYRVAAESCARSGMPKPPKTASSKMLVELIYEAQRRLKELRRRLRH